MTPRSVIELTTFCGSRLFVTLEGCDIVVRVKEKDNDVREIFKLGTFQKPLHSTAVVWSVQGSRMMGIGDKEVKRAEKRIICAK